MAADEGEDEEGEQDVEEGGEEEGDEYCLGRGGVSGTNVETRGTLRVQLLTAAAAW